MSSRRWGAWLSGGFLLALVTFALLGGGSPEIVDGAGALQAALVATTEPSSVVAWWAPATRTVLGVVTLATIVSAVLGAALGALSVFVDGSGGGALSRLVELGASVPGLIVVGVWRLWDASGGVWALLGTLAMLRSLELAQLVRAHVQATLPNEFVEASRSFGATRRWQLRAHVVPRLTRPLLVNLCSGAASLIGLEAALTFVGLGLPNDVASWGGGLAVLSSGGNTAGNTLALVCVLASIGLTSAAFHGLGVCLWDAVPKRVPRALAPKGAQVK